MARYIDAEPYDQILEQREKALWEIDAIPVADAVSQCRKLLSKQPTIEVEPVVHAYWEIYNEDSDNYWKRGWRCSHCKGYHFHNGGMIKKYKRCPNCGAHIDLKED